MRITARGLNRATLARQLLLRRQRCPVIEAIHRVVALQAQHAASPYLALWNRIDGFDPADLDAAIAGREVVKATLMRVTLHLVHAADYRALREGMEPTLRAARLHDNRFTMSGLTVEDTQELIPGLLGYAEHPRTAAEMEGWCKERMGTPETGAGAWWGLRQYAPLWHAPSGMPWSFGQRPSYVGASPRPVLADSDAAAAGLQTLVKRYLEGFGPASLPDLAQFVMGYRPLLRAALKAISDQLEWLEGPDGQDLVDLPGAPRPPDDTSVPPRLMAMWDSILLAYADRSRVLPPDYRRLVIQSNGDVLPALLVDGYVAGVWRPVEGGVEVTAFHPLSSDTWESLANEARALLVLLAAREPLVYRRYDRWWTHFAGFETRLLPGR